MQKRNPELWKRGVELMKQSGLWEVVLNSRNYGKNWQEMGITGERLDNLIASEIHAQLTGKQGAATIKKLDNGRTTRTTNAIIDMQVFHLRFGFALCFCLCLRKNQRYEREDYCARREDTERRIRL